ncbi:lipopolysaccharide biosynthesis protein [Ktedonosporobacter rubrisoli]|nr:polysaccharide biosynthesis C-terminal domain-containing protein [Ktedonosporobacter rubrisoli]
MFLVHARSSLGKRGFFQPGLVQAAMSCCSALLGIGNYVLILRMLAPDDFGTYMLVLWLAASFVPILGTGTSRQANRQLAEIQSQEAPRYAAGIFYFLWYRQCRSMLCYCLVYLLLSFPLSWLFSVCRPLLLLMAGLSTLPLLLSNVVGITLRSQRSANLLAGLHLCGAFLSLLLIFIVALLPGQYVGMLLLALTLANTLTLIIAVVCVLRLLPMREALPPGFFLRERLLQGLKHQPLLFVLDVIVWQHSELLLLACLRGASELGCYELCILLSTGMIELAPALASYLLPWLIRYLPGAHDSGLYRAFVKTSSYIALLAVPICLLVAVLAPQLIAGLNGAYLPAVAPLRILLVGCFFSSVATVSLTHLSYGQRKTAQLRLSIGVAILHIVLAIPCVALWGMLGAALASASAQVASAIGSIFICRNMLRQHELCR